MTQSNIQIILEAAREAGLCAECPAIIGPAMRAIERDDAQKHDDSLTDVEIDSLYDQTIEPLRQIDMNNAENLREGRRRMRGSLTSFDALVLHGLGSFTKDGPCKGILSDQELPDLSNDAVARRIVAGLENFRHSLMALIGQAESERKPYHCELSVRRSTAFIQAIAEDPDELAS